MTDIHARRLLRLAAFLDTLPEENFDLDDWGHKSPVVESLCGTVACIAGWAGRMPEFQALGLCLILGDPPSRCADLVFEPVTPYDTEAAAPHIDPEEGDVSGFRGPQVFLGLNDEEADGLFYGDYFDVPIVTPSMAAAKIRDVVSDHFPAGVPTEGPLA